MNLQLLLNIQKSANSPLCFATLPDGDTLPVGCFDIDHVAQVAVFSPSKFSVLDWEAIADATKDIDLAGYAVFLKHKRNMWAVGAVIVDGGIRLLVG